MSAAEAAPSLRIGIDLGGTKIAGLALAPDGRTLAEHRIAGAAPRLRGNHRGHR